MFKKVVKAIGTFAVTAWVWANVTVGMAMADSSGSGSGSVNIGTGLTTVNTSTIAGDVKTVALGISGLAGVVALGALTWAGMSRMWDHTAQGRADNRERLIDIFKGLGIVGLACLFVGFAAYVIQQATGG